jgi:hypothetical protein
MVFKWSKARPFYTKKYLFYDLILFIKSSSFATGLRSDIRSGCQMVQNQDSRPFNIQTQTCPDITGFRLSGVQFFLFQQVGIAAIFHAYTFLWSYWRLHFLSMSRTSWLQSSRPLKSGILLYDRFLL